MRGARALRALILLRWNVLHVLLIGLGGALGAVTRHAVDQVTITQLGSSLVGTFIANISGTFLLGLLVGLLSSHPAWPAEMRIFLTVGFLASYATFFDFKKSMMRHKFSNVGLLPSLHIS